MRYLATFTSPNYGNAQDPSDVRLFDSLRDASEWLEDAYSANGRRPITSTYADGETTSDFMPCVDTGAALTLAPIADDDDAYAAAQAWVWDGELSPTHSATLNRNGRARAVRN